jgi:RNA polymerase sigma-70 factor (ECF subfamily)
MSFNPGPSASSGIPEDFMQRLTGAQSYLYAFICSLMGGTREARDVLQETNLVLWTKLAEYDPARDFLSWAYTFARFQVMAHRKHLSRDRLVLDDEFVGRVAALAAPDNADLEDRLRAMDDCIGKLPSPQKEVVRRRYSYGHAVNAIAVDTGRLPCTFRTRLRARAWRLLVSTSRKGLSFRGCRATGLRISKRQWRGSVTESLGTLPWTTQSGLRGFALPPPSGPASLGSAPDFSSARYCCNCSTSSGDAFSSGALRMTKPTSDRPNTRSAR